MPAKRMARNGGERKLTSILISKNVHEDLKGTAGDLGVSINFLLNQMLPGALKDVREKGLIVRASDNTVNGEGDVNGIKDQES